MFPGTTDYTPAPVLSANAAAVEENIEAAAEPVEEAATVEAAEEDADEEDEEEEDFEIVLDSLKAADLNK